MEVKDGYKKTEIGVIPVDWDVVSVDKNFDFYQNNTYSRDCMNEKGGDIQNIHYGDILIKYGSILDCDKENIPFLNMGISVSLSNRTVQSGDIIIADTAEDNTVGKAIEVINTKGRKVVSGLHTIFIRPHAGLFAERYLGYFFNAPVYHNQLLPYIVGIKVSSISKKTIRNTIILRPCLAEQQAIAEALSDVDAVVSSLTKLINKKKNIKQGAMQELLTGKKRLDGFSGDWEVVEFKDIFIKHQTKNYQINSVDYMEVGSHPVIDQGKKKIVAYSERKDKLFSCPTEGIIVFGDHTRELKFINFDFVIGADGTQVISTKNDNNVQYYYYSLMEKEIPNTGYNRHYKYLLEMKFYRPKLEEQTAIASILSDMDAEIEALEQKLNKYKAIKQSMMQELLTGRIRLI